MATRSVFEVGNKITMQLVKKGGVFAGKVTDKNTYTSQLMHIISEKELTIATPFNKNKLVPLANGDIYVIRFYTKNGLYQCKCVIQKTGLEVNIATANVKMISNLERHQRREYYRMDTRNGMKFALIDEYQEKLFKNLRSCTTNARKKLVEEQIKIEQIKFGKGLMLDISGGGMKFNSREKMEKDDTLVLFPDLSPISDEIPFFLGHIVLTRQVGFKPPTYENKIKFFDISNAEREKIITYIFATEREKMKNE